MKLSHRRVKFEHPAQGMNQCSDCFFWKGSRPDKDSCRIVRAPVTRLDWCNRWERRNAR